MPPTRKHGRVRRAREIGVPSDGQQKGGGQRPHLDLRSLVRGCGKRGDSGSPVSPAYNSFPTLGSSSPIDGDCGLPTDSSRQLLIMSRGITP
jgi:hypothetical protein